MAVKYTADQQKAIDTLDKSILVAAAAGSGKTAVLVQRIINIILEGKSNVDEMLVVTFTKAAAAEMRLKLAKAIKKRMQEDPGSAVLLRDQLNRLYRAYISTFDSFALRIIKEFFYLIDIEPNFKACDEIQSSLLQRDAVDTLFDEAFEDDEYIPGGSFREFLRLYSSDRNEELIKTDIIESYKKLRTMPNYFDWALKSIEDLKLTRDKLADTNLEKGILADAAEAFSESVAIAEEIRALFVEHGIESKFNTIFGPEYGTLCKLRDKALSGHLDEEFIQTIEALDFPDLRSYTQYFEKGEEDMKKAYAGFKTQITPIRKRYKDKLVVPFRERYFLPDFDTRIDEMNKTYKYTLYYINMLIRFEEIYQEEKREARLLDFSDMSHTAVRILENEEAANTLRKRFNFIFIDEYQDTNNIQEYLIDRFAREDNLFKVGDVKQSIYRFRQAEPSIFEKVYKEYSDESKPEATSIDLNMNFRSNSKTIMYINEIFRNVMEGYDERAALHFGLENSETYNPDYDFIPEVHLLYTNEEDSSDDYEYEGAETVDELEEEINNLSKEEAEAAYIAKLVSGIIGTEFNDTVTGEVRRAEARDIVILLRSVKYKGEIYARALRTANIQSHIEEEENFFDAVEIGIALSLLSTIDNMKRDVPLIATLHSEIFGWTPEDLAQLRIEHRAYVFESGMYDNSKRTPYWEALEWYSENGGDDGLRERARFAIAKIKEWRKLSKMMTIEDFIWRLLIDSGYYRIVGAMYSGDRRQANLRALVDRARKYSEDTIASLSTFLDFLNIMKTQKVSNGQVSMVSKDDDVVKITTIHKSKGLEYPFVIVGGLGVQFHNEGSKRTLSFDSELGIALPYYSPDRKYWRSSLMQRAIAVKENNDSYKEELRVLYVALTRARNKLHLVGTVASEEKLLEKTGRPKCFMEVIKDSIHTPFNEYHICPLEMTDREKDRVYVKDILASRPEVMSPETLKIYEEVERRLSYQYPDDALLEMPAKLSVSAIRKEELKAQAKAAEHGANPMDDSYQIAEAVAPDNEVVHLWLGTDNMKKASAVDKGIAYHRIMEFLDFTKIYAGEPSESGEPDTEYIRERAQYLCDNGAVDEDVFKALNLAHIEKFFRGELGRRACMAAGLGKLKKEKAFTLRTEWEGQKVLVQGVIDCCWEEDGKMVLIDYKSSFINPSKDRKEEIARIRDEYKTQIELYAEAITAGSGMQVKEAYLYLFSVDEAVKL